jgi:repressor LexA
MLLAHGDPVAGFAETFRNASAHGPLVCLELEGVELDRFLDAFEQTANSAQNEVAMERLGQAFTRVAAGFAGDTDPGWHMLRPALSCVDMSPEQGQYLAFIQAYTRLHRRAPAESEIQDYFRTTPPSVHEMLKTLQRNGFISRVAGVARSTTLLLAPHEIPELE